MKTFETNEKNSAEHAKFRIEGDIAFLTADEEKKIAKINMSHPDGVEIIYPDGTNEILKGVKGIKRIDENGVETLTTN